LPYAHAVPAWAPSGTLRESPSQIAWMPSLSRASWKSVGIHGFLRGNPSHRSWNPHTPSFGAETSRATATATALSAVALGPVAQAYFRYQLLIERFGSVRVGAFALPRFTTKLGIRCGLAISVAWMLWSFHVSFLSVVSGALAALVTSAGAGVAAGVLHSLSGPDHIAGLAAHAINQPFGSAVGLATVWASGHVTGQCGIGAALVFMRAIGAPGINQVLFERWSTIGVAVTLMIIGAAGLLEARAQSDEAEQQEVGAHTQQTQQTKSVKWMRTFTTGFVHGLSPDGLFMLFPLLTMSVSRGMMHLLGIFGGTCLAMSMCTAGLSVAARRLERLSVEKGAEMGRMQTVISVVSSLVALGFGGIMLCTGFLRAF